MKRNAGNLWGATLVFAFEDEIREGHQSAGAVGIAAAIDASLRAPRVFVGQVAGTGQRATIAHQGD